MGTERPTFEFICQAQKRFMNTISCKLKQITNIESNFIKSYGNDCQFTTLPKNTIYIMKSRKGILQSRLHKEKAIRCVHNLMQPSQCASCSHAVCCSHSLPLRRHSVRIRLMPSERSMLLKIGTSRLHSAMLLDMALSAWRRVISSTVCRQPLDLPKDNCFLTLALVLR